MLIWRGGWGQVDTCKLCRVPAPWAACLQLDTCTRTVSRERLVLAPLWQLLRPSAQAAAAAAQIIFKYFLSHSTLDNMVGIEIFSQVGLKDVSYLEYKWFSAQFKAHNVQGPGFNYNQQITFSNWSGPVRDVILVTIGVSAIHCGK